jgi:hypothetical protein
MAVPWHQMSVKVFAKLEQSRARLNHDLLKNRLMLELTHLRSIVSGRVALAAGSATVRQKAFETWRLAEADALQLISGLENADVCTAIFSLPFVRGLDGPERAIVQSMLALATHSFRLQSVQGAELRGSLRYVGVAIERVRSGSDSAEIDLANIEQAILCLRKMIDSMERLRKPGGGHVDLGLGLSIDGDLAVRHAR